MPCFAYAASDPAAKNRRNGQSANQQSLLWRAATRAVGLSSFDDDYDSDDSDGISDDSNSNASKSTATGECVNAPKEGRNVVLYCHGGAFVASLHAADLHALTDWAIATGSVVLFPDYSLAPDHPCVSLRIPSLPSLLFPIRSFFVFATSHLHLFKIIFLTRTYLHSFALLTFLCAALFFSLLLTKHSYPDGLDQLLDVYLALDAKRANPRVGSQQHSQDEQQYSSSSSSQSYSSSSSSSSSSSFSESSTSSASYSSTRTRSSSSSSSRTSSWRVDELAWLGGPVGRIALVGESAGGNLATALTIRLLLLQDRAATAAAKRSKSTNASSTHRPHYSMNGDCGSNGTGSSSRNLPNEASVDYHNMPAAPPAAKSPLSASTSISGSLSDLMQGDASDELRDATSIQNNENQEMETLEVKETQVAIEEGILSHDLKTIPEKNGASGSSLDSSSTTSRSSGEASLCTPGFEGTQALSGGDQSMDASGDEDDAAYGVGLVHIDGRRQSMDISEMKPIMLPIPPTESSPFGHEIDSASFDTRSDATECNTESNTYGGNNNSDARQRRGPQLPDGLVLLYPSLNLSLAPSPSRAIHNFDPVLPIGIM